VKPRWPSGAFTGAQLNEMASLYEDWGWSLRRLAKHYRRDKKVIWRNLQHMGVTFRASGFEWRRAA
jgi:hypothetical protein